MSQNPPGGPPNYNPYGPNPSNPNYPATPGTAYGGGSQPPSGPNPGYNPYPASNPPASGDPHTPNSSYGPYSNPYAPPPPPNTGPNPYGNPPTPPPPSTGPNPYDAYAPTVMSQNPPSGPAYPPYPEMPPPPATPGIQSPQRGRAGLITAVIIALVVIVGGAIFGVIAYNNNQATIHANATATAQANLNAQATGTAQAYATATAIASNYPFSNKLVLSDPMVDNSKGMNWDDKQSIGCFFSGSAYHIIQADSQHYNTCAALNSDFSDFTYQVEMVIKKGGDGAAGGLIFRADENHSKFYRLSIDTNGNYFVLVVVDTTGTNGNARVLKQGTASSFTTGLGQTNTLGIVARGDQYSFYVNQQLVTSFTDSTYTHGQIGFDADYGTSATEDVFTNVKVWQLL